MNKCGSLVLCNVAVNFVIFVLLVDLAAVICLVDSKSKSIQTLKTRLAKKNKNINLTDKNSLMLPYDPYRTA